MTKTIIWDFDGTLADTRPLIEAGMAHTLDRLGLDPGLIHEWLKYVGLPLEDGLVRTFGPVGLSMEDVLPAYRSYGHADHEDLIRPFEGMDGLLAEIHRAGIPMAIATSKRRIPVVRQVAGLGWSAYFATIVTPDEVARPKPDPESLHRILEIHGLDPGEALMVGDTPFDLEMARAAGVPSVGVSHGFYGAEALLPWGPLGCACDTAGLRDLLHAWSGPWS